MLRDNPGAQRRSFPVLPLAENRKGANYGTAPFYPTGTECRVVEEAAFLDGRRMQLRVQQRHTVRCSGGVPLHRTLCPVDEERRSATSRERALLLRDLRDADIAHCHVGVPHARRLCAASTRGDDARGDDGGESEAGESNTDPLGELEGDVAGELTRLSDVAASAI